ncbi:integrase [Filibacter limicola]|uniref:Integrase n=1 Tax=Sporosarcina limicola TaxID=34101 RepID=A0A927R570_9BACL|nr:integrase [Sporosarcina limicola]
MSGEYIRIPKGGFKTKTEARHAAEKIEEEIRSGTYIKESKMTFNELFNKWLSQYEKRAKISSVRARKIAAKKLLDEWEHYPISKITMTMYHEHLDELSARFSYNYLDSIHTTGRMIFKLAMMQNLIKSNPTEHYEKPRVKNDVIKEEVNEVDNFLDRGELAEFLTLAKNEGMAHDLLIFSTLAYSGLRLGELLALKESDIDFKTNEISVTKTYYNPTNKKSSVTLLTPKTKGSYRKFNIDPFVIQLIKERVKEQKEEKMKHRMIYKDEGFIFADAQGYPFTMKFVAIRLQRLMKIMKRMNEGKDKDKDKDKNKNKKKHITPHSFRHTNISLLIEANVPIGEIQRRVGHTDIQTTMNIYAHMTKETKDQASLLFSDHLSDLTRVLR